MPRNHNQKTPADIAEEERLKKADAESDSLFDNDPILGQAYDEISTRENQKINKHTKKKTITGAEIIDRLLSRTNEIFNRFAGSGILGGLRINSA